MLSACGSTPPEERAPASDRLDPVLSVGPEPAPRDTRAATNPSRTPAPSGSPADSTAPRADGRPSWWLDEPQTRDGALVLSAEALGDDVRAARRAAVDAAIESLERSLAAPPTDERILAAVVVPLPRRADAPGAARFVGYVLISHPLPPQPDGAAR